MDLIELKTLHDKAYQSNQITRERASDDMVFYWVTQWDDQILADTDLAYRGEFNILRKAGRQITSDLASNPIQVDFVPKGETRDDAADLADGLYRKDGNHNMSLEAYENAKSESIVCGVGAWELYTEYVTQRSGNKDQVIKRRPLYEANNNVFWDPNSKLMDKSDAKYCSVLVAYSEDGYKDLVKELTGEEIETVSMDSFKHPEHSYTFPWIGGQGKKIYVVSFYYREKVKETILTMVDPFGQTMDLSESSLAQIEDELMDAGYVVDSTKKVERYRVTKYIASGADILSKSILPGEHITIIPCYGERAYIEGEEHYEGVTRLAKDPQRLRNFQLSYLADLTSQSPREQPIFFPEQIAGFEHMYQGGGIDNTYPYLYQNMKGASGEQLPIGPVGVMPSQPIPQSLAASIEVTRQAVEDVANPGIPQSIADPDTSGKAVLALQARLDMQSMVYQEHHKHAKRRDAEVWVSIAAEIHDVPRKTNVEMPDGTRKTVEIMQAVVDQETGDIVFLNDLRNSEFEVYSEIGASYSSQRDQTLDRLESMIATMIPGDPMRTALQLKQLTLMDGVDFDGIRKSANKQLVLTGFKDPESDEEEQALEASKNNAQEPDAAMVLAKAEELKGQADIMREKREGVSMQLTNANTKSGQQIDVFKAQTERMKVMVEAQKAGATIDKTQVETVGKQLDNQGKIIELQIPKVRTEKDMSDDELFQRLLAG